MMATRKALPCHFRRSELLTFASARLALLMVSMTVSGCGQAYEIIGGHGLVERIEVGETEVRIFLANDIALSRAVRLDCFDGIQPGTSLSAALLRPEAYATSLYESQAVAVPNEDGTVLVVERRIASDEDVTYRMELYCQPKSGSLRDFLDEAVAGQIPPLPRLRRVGVYSESPMRGAVFLELIGDRVRLMAWTLSAVLPYQEPEGLGRPSTG